jgi:hypothetical protein
MKIRTLGTFLAASAISLTAPNKAWAVGPALPEEWLDSTPAAGPFPLLGVIALIMLLPLLLSLTQRLRGKLLNKDRPLTRHLSTALILLCLCLLFACFFPNFIATACFLLVLLLGLYLITRYDRIRKWNFRIGILSACLSLLTLSAFDLYQLFPAAYYYSPAQETLLGELGNPDAFEIVFYPDDKGEISREETWLYYDYETVVSFLNGEFLYSEDLPYQEEEYLPSPYQPAQFNGYMGRNYIWDSFTESISDENDDGMMPSFALDDVWPELIEGMDISMQYHDQIVLGFDNINKRLTYVSAPAAEKGE